METSRQGPGHRTYHGKIYSEYAEIAADRDPMNRTTRLDVAVEVTIPDEARISMLQPVPGLRPMRGLPQELLDSLTRLVLAQIANFYGYYPSEAEVLEDEVVVDAEVVEDEELEVRRELPGASEEA